MELDLTGYTQIN
jgi:serine/threonine protein kinase